MSDTQRRGHDRRSIYQPDLTDQALEMGDYEVLGKALTAEVVEAVPEYFEGEGRYRKLRPRVVLRITGGIEPTPGIKLRTPERPRQIAEVVEVEDGLVALRIIAGMGRGRRPAPDSVPEVGEHVHYFQMATSDSKELVASAAELELSGENTTLPVKIVTMNQLVAYNLTYWRKYQGLTQEDLGRNLAAYNGGEAWSKANVSAAERTWDGTRVRRFDADDILMFARFFGVPIAAMLLPPEDAGVKVRYIVGDPTLPADSDDLIEMSDYVEFIADIEPADGGSVLRYQLRLGEFVDFHYGSGTYSQWITASGDDGETQYHRYAEQGDRVRRQIGELRGLLGDLERIEHAINEKTSSELNARLAAMDKKRTQDAAEDLPDDQAERVIELYKSGESIAAIAVALDAPERRIFRVLHRSGAYTEKGSHREHLRALSAKVADRYLEGESIESIAVRVNHSERRVYAALLLGEVPMRTEDTRSYFYNEWEKSDDGTDSWDHLA